MEDEDDARPRRRPRRREYDDDIIDADGRRRPWGSHRDDDGTGGLIPYKNPNALIAYYAAIFGFFLPLIGSAIAVILGFKGLIYAKEHPRARGQVHAWIGILGGFGGVVFWMLVLAVIAFAYFKK